MKKILQVVAFTILCFSIIVSHAQIAENAQPLSRNYADMLISSSNVNNPQNAVDADLTNYALMQTDIGVANTSALKLGWSQLGMAGESAVVEIQNDGGLLTLDVLQSITLILYDNAGNMVRKKAGFDFTEVKAGDDPSRYKIHVAAGNNIANIASVKIRLNGLVALQNRLRVYYAYLANICPTIHGDILHAHHNVQNAGNAISADKNDFATLTPSLVGNSYLDIAFSQPGQGGKNVGFYLGEGNASLDLTLLQHITATVYDTNGGIVVSKSDFVLADAEILPGGRFNLPVKTPKGNYQIGRGRITFTSFVNVLTTLKVYTIVMHETCTSNTPEAVSVNNSTPLPVTDLQVYPNPFNSYTTLNVKGILQGTSHIIISDKAGNLTEEHEFTGSGNIRLLEKAAPGIYLIKMISGDLVETRKVIKL